ncbi:winged helix-turn-helix transcriptional regulator [Nonomuraea sp. NPDC049152]|uniref:winged helix-turn-helix transcriptional regulator n=1 Tax=Nonomuraea sp. NPDC049152 TaxID=3154350 RepID=UPI003404BF2D
MVHARRNYGQYCGLAAALDVIGERWTLLIIRELLLGPRRYSDLIAALPGVGTNLLAERLKFLTAEGVLRKVADDQGKDRGYELTEIGGQLREPVLSLARWGLPFLDEPMPEEVVRPHWGFLAVQAMIDDSRVPDLDEVYEFRVDDVRFHVLVRDGSAVAVEGGYSGSPTVTAITDARTFMEIGSKRLSPFGAVVSGRLTLQGPPEAILRVSALLGLVPEGTPDQARGAPSR